VSKTDSKTNCSADIRECQKKRKFNIGEEDRKSIIITRQSKGGKKEQKKGEQEMTTNS